VLAALQDSVIRHRLPRAEFAALFDARAAELDRPAEAAPDLDALEAFSAGSGAPIVRLALSVLGARGPAADAAAGHVGTAWALTGQARAVLLHAAETGISGTGAIAGLARDLAARAALHLEAARAAAAPRAAVPALLPAVIARGYLATLHAARFAPGDGRIVRDRPNVVRLIWAAAVGRV
jgi:phytoene synthase